MKIMFIFGTIILIFSLTLSSRAQEAAESLALPNPELKQYLQQRKRSERPAPGAFESAPVFSLTEDSIHYQTLQKAGRVYQPLHVSDEALIQLKADISPREVSSLIEQYGLTVIDTFPEIGTLHVNIANLRQRSAAPAPAEVSPATSSLTPALNALKQDARILSV